jgi:hypothetical protein
VVRVKLLYQVAWREVSLSTVDLLLRTYQFQCMHHLAKRTLRFGRLVHLFNDSERVGLLERCTRLEPLDRELVCNILKQLVLELYLFIQHILVLIIDELLLQGYLLIRIKELVELVPILEVLITSKDHTLVQRRVRWFLFHLYASLHRGLVELPLHGWK